MPLLALPGSLTLAVADAAATGLLTGVAVGRLGCFRSGCCAGRSGRLGPFYPWLPGEDRRYPVQLLESASCLLLETAMLGLVL